MAPIANVTDCQWIWLYNIFESGRRSTWLVLTVSLPPALNSSQPLYTRCCLVPLCHFPSSPSLHSLIGSFFAMADDQVAFYSLIPGLCARHAHYSDDISADEMVNGPECQAPHWTRPIVAKTVLWTAPSCLGPRVKKKLPRATSQRHWPFCSSIVPQASQAVAWKRTQYCVMVV